MSANLKKQADALFAPVYARWPIELTRGRGCLLYDAGGREILDFVGGIATCLVGHGRPEVAEALRNQALELTNATNLYYTRPQTELAAELKKISGLPRAFLCNSGTEAIEAALKFARRATGRTRFVAFTGAFHGRSLGSLSATHKPQIRDPFKPLIPGFVHVPYGDLAATRRAVNERTAAVLVEPFQGEAGVVPAPAGFLKELQQLCREAGALLVLDEIQTGMGRTGKWFAYQHEGIAPDMVAVAKGLANGAPIGACLISEAVAAQLKPGDHGSTFGGNSLACAAALATLRVVRQDKLLGNARRMGKRLAAGLARLQSPRIIGGRGLGLLQALAFRDDPQDVALRALERGLLVLPTSKSALRLLPPLCVNAAQIDRALEILKESL